MDPYRNVLVSASTKSGVSGFALRVRLILSCNISFGGSLRLQRLTISDSSSVLFFRAFPAWRWGWYHPLCPGSRRFFSSQSETTLLLKSTLEVTNMFAVFLACWAIRKGESACPFLWDMTARLLSHCVFPEMLARFEIYRNLAPFLWAVARQLFKLLVSPANRPDVGEASSLDRWIFGETFNGGFVLWWEAAPFSPDHLCWFSANRI